MLGRHGIGISEGCQGRQDAETQIAIRVMPEFELGVVLKIVVSTVSFEE
jgi:hypothetical protein